MMNDTEASTEQLMLFCLERGYLKMKLHVDLKERGYDIVLERGVLNRIAEEIDVGRRILLVSDSGVPAKWVELVRAQCPDCVVKIVRSGEEAKSFPVWEELLLCMKEHHFVRKDLVIALGGGVVGDLAGFAAACYMRGIDFVNIPTTTLSQIDSSIGGKTATSEKLPRSLKKYISSFIGFAPADDPAAITSTAWLKH